jgi:hypothetical protein
VFIHGCDRQPTVATTRITTTAATAYRHHINSAAREWTRFAHPAALDADDQEPPDDQVLAAIAEGHRRRLRAVTEHTIAKLADRDEVVAGRGPSRRRNGVIRSRLRWRPVVSLLSTVTVLVLASTADARPGGVIRTGRVGVTRLGSWHVSASGSYQSARGVFGRPDRERVTGQTCDDTWNAVGLRVVFTTFGIRNGCRSMFGQAAWIRGNAGRRPWRTLRGVRVGDTASRVGRLYPGAIRVRGGRVLVWNRRPPIGTGRLDIVTAHIARGHVTSLELWLGAAGD